MKRCIALTTLLLLWAMPAFATFPVVAATATATDVVNDTNHTVNLPASISAGDLLIVVHVGSATDATPNSALTGWTLLRDKTIASNAGHVVAFYKIASGAEGSTATITTDLAEDSGSCAYRITGWHGTTPPEASAGATTGSNTAPDPDAVTPSWGAEDNLFIAVGDADGNHTITAYPANYGSNNITSATSTAGGGACGLATRNLNATTDDPGAFTSNTSGTTAGFTIVVRPGVSVAVINQGTLLGVGK